jgi:flagellar motility protein MotE (MotC chaperone)
MTIRLLPATMGVALVLFALKAVEMWEGSSSLFSAPAATAMLNQVAIITPAQAQQAATPTAAAPTQAPVTNQAAAGFTAAELDMLQNLKLRREELDEREREIDLRANLLAVSERRVEERIAELKKIEQTIDGLLVKYDEQQEKQLAAVVKIYEAMKPKDAAAIFNRLQMPVLIEIAERIKERTMAPILSEMDPTVANALTIEMATRHALPKTGVAN